MESFKINGLISVEIDQKKFKHNIIAFKLQKVEKNIYKTLFWQV